MKDFRKLFWMSVLMLNIGFTTAWAGWEIISPNPKMLNIEIMGDTWFGMEYY